MSANSNAKIIEDQVNELSDSDGKLNYLGMWKIKNRVAPKERDPPMGKTDESGNLITAEGPLKNLYLSTYKNRLRNREIAEGMEDIQIIKEDLWSRRLEIAKKKKTPNWSMKQLDIILKSLKTNKARGPDGLVNEIFRPNVAGEDLKVSILNLMNSIKSTQVVPKVLRSPNITSIHKNKGSKNDLENDRGIFMLCTLRTILDKLIYFDTYEDIEFNMSDSNIGARKNKDVKNHLFIVNGILNEVKNDKSMCIDLELMDISKCFDSLWVQEIMNDMSEVTEVNDKLSLMYLENKESHVAISTPVGMTERCQVDNIEMQGSVLGPIKTAV